MTTNSDPEIPAPRAPDVPASALEKTAPANLRESLESRLERVEEAEVRKQELGVTDITSQLKMREEYAARLFKLSCVWLGFIALALLLAGTGKLRLADSVQIALISTTTVNVLGLFYIVARWLFPTKGNNDLPAAKTAKQTQTKKVRAKDDQFT